MAKERKYNVCLDIGGTKILGVIFDGDDKPVYKLKKKTQDSGSTAESIEEVIISVVKDMLKDADISESQVNAIAAGAPGVIDQANGIVLFSPNIPWRDYDIASAIRRKFKAPFYIGNDVNVGVLGEYKYGIGKGYRNIVGIFPGTGMGGGLILDGKLYTGNKFKAGEIGHMVMDPEGPLCGCGQRGCLEMFSSKKGMSAYVREQCARGRTSMLEEGVKDGGVFKSKLLKKALTANDPIAVEAVDRACHYLAIATGSLINIFSPDLIVYGGGVIEACGDIFLEKILAEVDRYCMPSIRSTVDIKNASLGDYSNIYGALAMIKEGGR